MADFRQSEDYKAIYARIEKAVKQIPARLAVVAVNFSKERFVHKNWLDVGTTHWKKTKKRTGSTLVASGRLKRSIRKISVTPSRIVVGTNMPYARAHNDGGEFSGTETVRKHTRKASTRRAHVRRGKTIKAQRVKGYTVRQHTRKYKRKFEKRQFIGKSKDLQGRLQRTIERELRNAMYNNRAT